MPAAPPQAFPRGKRAGDKRENDDEQRGDLFLLEGKEKGKKQRRRGNREGSSGNGGNGLNGNGGKVDSLQRFRANMGGGNVKHADKYSTIETIGWGKLSKGMKVLGVVKEIVSDDLATVGLGNRLVGYIMRKDEVRSFLARERHSF